MFVKSTGFLLSIACVTLSTSLCQARTYRCEVTSITKLQENGTLREDGFTQLLKKSIVELYWDEEAGVLRTVYTEIAPRSEAFSLLQKGSNDNSSVGISIVRGPASTPVSTITIRTFMKGMPFLLSDLFDGTVYTGNCRPIS